MNWRQSFLFSVAKSDQTSVLISSPVSSLSCGFVKLALIHVATLTGATLVLVPGIAFLGPEQTMDVFYQLSNEKWGIRCSLIPRHYCVDVTVENCSLALESFLVKSDRAVGSCSRGRGPVYRRPLARHLTTILFSFVPAVHSPVHQSRHG